MSRKRGTPGGSGVPPFRKGGSGGISSQGQQDAPQSPASSVARRWLSNGRWLIGVAAVALVVGLYALTLAMSYRLPLVYDESIYLQIGQRVGQTGCPVIATGDGAVFADSPPLVMYVMAAARAVGGDGLMWLRSVHVTVWVLPCYVAMCVLAWRAFGPAAGLLAVASFFTQQGFMREAAEVKLDVPVASLAAVFLVSLSYVRDAASRRARALATAVCALCAGLACVTKYQGVLLPFTGVVVLLAGRWMGPRPAAAVRGLPELWLVAGAVVGGLAWFALNSVCGGNLVATVLANLRRVTFQTSETWFTGRCWCIGRTSSRRWGRCWLSAASRAQPCGWHGCVPRRVCCLSWRGWW